MNRKSKWLGMLILLALLVSACGGGATPAPQTAAPTEAPAVTETEPPAQEGPFRVAVVMPSATNDLAFSQSMFDALTAIQTEMGADNFEFAHSENMFVVDEAAAALRDYASQGYNLVIAHGSQYGSSLQEIAPDFPETSFAWGTTVDTFVDQGINNVYAYEARSEQGGYVNGVIAASLSESNVLGVVGPIETGDAKLYVDGFVAGAKATKPDITVNVNYTGSFSDVALASEAARTHVSAGADALTGTAQMVVGAIGVAEENGLPWFGTQSSQTSLAPEIVVANQVYDWTVVLNEIIAKVKSGQMGGEAFAATLENGGLVMDYNPDYELPAEVKTLADETVQGIIDGSIVIGEAPAPEETAAPTEAAVSDIGTAEHPIKVLFVPSVDANVIVSGGEIMAQALNEATGLTFEVSVPTSYAATIEEMCASPADTIGFIPGLGYVLANQLCGVDVAFKAVRFGWDVYWAQIIVPRDSDIQSIADLAGKKWAYPDAGSTSGYLAILPMLQEAGIDPASLEVLEAGGHNGAVRAIYNGEADFGSTFFSPPLKPEGEPAWDIGDPPDIPDELVDSCAVSEDGEQLTCSGWRVLDARQTIREEAPDVIQKVKILAISPEIPNDTLSFGPEFPAELRAQIADALVAFAETEAWNNSIGSQDFYGWTGLSPSTDEEFDIVRQMVELAGLTLEDLGQ